VGVVAFAHGSGSSRLSPRNTQVARGLNDAGLGTLLFDLLSEEDGRHPVEFGTSTKKITSWPFKGVFRDFIVWPRESRGIPLKFRVIVVVGRAKRVVDYAVTPRG
jgi:diadenosine tetraphosphatase ApaH/serine/threonine PP2A family protein phosphatase